MDPSAQNTRCDQELGSGDRRPVPCIETLAQGYTAGKPQMQEDKPSHRTRRGELLPIVSHTRNALTTGQNYEFRYDDGLSARLGVRRIPFLGRQIGRDGEMLFRNPPDPFEKRLRTEREPLKAWWPPIPRCPVFYEKPPQCPRYIGLCCDPTRVPPNETVLRNF